MQDSGVCIDEGNLEYQVHIIGEAAISPSRSVSLSSISECFGEAVTHHARESGGQIAVCMRHYSFRYGLCRNKQSYFEVSTKLLHFDTCPTLMHLTWPYRRVGFLGTFR